MAGEGGAGPPENSEGACIGVGSGGGAEKGVIPEKVATPGEVDTAEKPKTGLY